MAERLHLPLFMCIKTQQAVSFCALNEQLIKSQQNNCNCDKNTNFMESFICGCQRGQSYFAWYGDHVTLFKHCHALLHGRPEHWITAAVWNCSVQKKIVMDLSWLYSRVCVFNFHCFHSSTEWSIYQIGLLTWSFCAVLHPVLCCCNCSSLA